jgi:hypothetical protein
VNIRPNDTIESKEHLAEKYLTNSNGEISLALMSGGVQKVVKTFQSSNDSEKRVLSFGRKTSGPYCDHNSMEESLSSHKKPRRLVDIAEKLLERMALKVLRKNIGEIYQQS